MVWSEIGFHETGHPLHAINAVKELRSDLGRSNADLYEVGLWEDLVMVRGNELFYTYNSSTPT